MTATLNTMKINGLYKWKHEMLRLVYLGRHGSWHQFALVASPDTVWCEVLTQDLHMLEETE